MRSTSNPVFRNLPRQEGSGYANFGSGVTGAGQMGQQYGNQYGQQYQQPQPYQQPTDTRAMTIDDVVTKTAITLGVLTLSAIASYALVAASVVPASLFMLAGIAGFVLVLVAVFARKMDNPVLVLSYAALQGLCVGALSFALTFKVGGVAVGGLIGQAVLGTFGVFFGMLVVYKTGAIRVTPRLTRMVVGATFGLVVLALGNAVASIFTQDGLGLRSGGTLAIIFSLFAIGLAAFNFLLDFDTADQLIRAQAPEKAAWGVALGLTVTLVWLYVEILQLLSYFNND
ncbi:Bax inhibitor-1/YccA family protein [Nocardia sp. NPDC050175]|uniref:Bax inhibitor-1/YccA family protein n=1 Tax=Nocardia sp. NPDC050175 TaxID=3364317 RepID=UPI0037994ECB